MIRLRLYARAHDHPQTCDYLKATSKGINALPTEPVDAGACANTKMATREPTVTLRSWRRCGNRQCGGVALLAVPAYVIMANDAVDDVLPQLVEIFGDSHPLEVLRAAARDGQGSVERSVAMVVSADGSYGRKRGSPEEHARPAAKKPKPSVSSPGPATVPRGASGPAKDALQMLKWTAQPARKTTDDAVQLDAGNITEHVPCELYPDFIPDDLADDLIRFFTAEADSWDHPKFYINEKGLALALCTRAPSWLMVDLPFRSVREPQGGVLRGRPPEGHVVFLVWRGDQEADVQPRAGPSTGHGAGQGQGASTGSRSAGPVRQRRRPVDGERGRRERIRERAGVVRPAFRQTDVHWPEACHCVPDGTFEDAGANGPVLIRLLSLQLGAGRTFRFRRIPRHNSPCKVTYNVVLPNRSLLVMFAPTQEEFKHELPRQKAVVTRHPICGDARYNITFRMYKDEFRWRPSADAASRWNSSPSSERSRLEDTTGHARSVARPAVVPFSGWMITGRLG